MILQRTIGSEVSCQGIGLHSGETVHMKLKPAKENFGVVFKRVDFPDDQSLIEARYDNVVDTRLGTTIANKSGAKAMTVEHFLSAAWGCGVDNLLVEIDGPEIPVMDGSSEPFIFLIECAGVVEQKASRKALEILKTVRFEGEDGKFIEVSPSPYFAIDISIEFDNKTIRRQKYDFDASNSSFKTNLCRARTFGFHHEVEGLRKIGLARGGSLENAIVVDSNGVMNKEGLRYKDEFVRHKTLDLVGDFYLGASYVKGHIKAFKPGHEINNKILRDIFADPEAARIIEMI